MSRKNTAKRDAALVALEITDIHNRTLLNDLECKRDAAKLELQMAALACKIAETCLETMAAVEARRISIQKHSPSLHAAIKAVFQKAMNRFKDGLS